MDRSFVEDLSSNKPRVIGFAIVALIIVTVVLYLLFGPEPAKPTVKIGILGAESFCTNERLQERWLEMGYKVECYGKTLGSSEMAGFLKDNPKEAAETDLAISSLSEHDKIMIETFGGKELATAGETKTVSATIPAFHSPVVGFVKLENKDVFVNAGLAEWDGKRLNMSTVTYTKLLELQATGRAYWSDAGVTHPKWGRMALIISIPNPFKSGTAAAIFDQNFTCMANAAQGFPPCSRPVDPEGLTDELKEKMYRQFVSYGGQDADNNVVKYYELWMNSDNILMLVGSESLPFLYASQKNVNDPNQVNRVVPVVFDYSRDNYQFFTPISDEGKAFAEAIAMDDTVTKIVMTYLGSRFGYKYTTIDPTLANWVGEDTTAYVTGNASSLKKQYMCYVGRRGLVPETDLAKTLGVPVNDLSTICP